MKTIEPPPVSSRAAPPSDTEMFSGATAVPELKVMTVPLALTVVIPEPFEKLTLGALNVTVLPSKSRKAPVPKLIAPPTACERSVTLPSPCVFKSIAEFKFRELAPAADTTIERAVPVPEPVTLKLPVPFNVSAPVLCTVMTPLLRVLSSVPLFVNVLLFTFRVMLRGEVTVTPAPIATGVLVVVAATMVTVPVP